MTALLQRSTWVQRALVAIIVVVCGSAFGWIVLARGSSAKRPAGAYILAQQGPLFVRAGWHRVQVPRALTLYAGQSAVLRNGEGALVLFPDGHTQKLSPGEHVDLPKSSGDEDDLLNLPLRTILQRFPVPPPDAQPSSPRIAILSPVGATRYLNPTISWEAKPDVLYNVAIVDPADPRAPPRVAQGVQPPISASTLQTTQSPTLPADRIFGIVVNPVGRPEPHGAAEFLTARDAAVAEPPTAPSELILEAWRAVTQKPARTGDAWIALSRLPRDWQKNELAIRLRLKVSILLGAPETFAQAHADAVARANR